jgi:type IV pilus assembly protein PilO
MAFLPKDQKKQKLLLLGILPLGLAVAYWFLFHEARAAEADVLQARVELLETQNNAMRVIVERFGDDLPHRLALYEEHVRQLEELIPRREDVPRLIHQITERALETGVDLAVIRPGSEQVGEFYSHQTFELQVIGHYHNIGEYLTAIGSLVRIVRPYEVKLTLDAVQQDRDGRPLLRAAFRIETYVMPDPTDLSKPVKDATT